MKTFWDERYGRAEYVYGVEPNLYFKAQLERLTPGKILLPAEGEGRNGVFAAKLGWDVYAFDQSSEGKKKADALAFKENVKISYVVATLDKITYPANSFDAIALIYAHIPGSARPMYHKQLVDYLRPGGILIYEAFSKNHIRNQEKNPTAGGPRDIDLLVSKEDIRSDFSELDILELVEIEAKLEEGLFHSGEATLIRFVGKKL